MPRLRLTHSACPLCRVPFELGDEVTIVGAGVGKKREIHAEHLANRSETRTFVVGKYDYLEPKISPEREAELLGEDPPIDDERGRPVWPGEDAR